MSAKPSGPANQAVAAEFEQHARDEQDRRRRVSIWEQELKQAARDEQRARGLRWQIDGLRQDKQENNGEQLRELGREHNELTGAGGRAV